MTDPTVAKPDPKALVDGLLTRVKNIGSNAVAMTALCLTVTAASIYTVEFGQGNKGYRLGIQFAEKDDIYVSTQIYMREDGKIFVAPEWFATPRNSSMFGCESVHLWVHCPGKQDANPRPLASGIPIQKESSTLAAFSAMVSAINENPEIIPELKSRGLIYQREFSGPNARTVLAMCLPYTSCGSPDLSLFGYADEKGEVKFLINPPKGTSDRLSFGKQNGYGVLISEVTKKEDGTLSASKAPHAINGVPHPLAVEALQKAFDAGMKIAEKPADFKAVFVAAGSRGRSSVLDALFATQDKAQATAQGIAQEQGVIAPAL